MTTLTMRFRMLVDGAPELDWDQKVEITPDDLGEDGGYERVCTFRFDEQAPPVQFEDGVRSRWTGGALNVPIRVSPEMARKALQEGTPLRSALVELPVTTTFKSGKEFFRNSEGRAEGVVDTTFAEVDWDYSRLKVVP